MSGASVNILFGNLVKDPKSYPYGDKGTVVHVRLATDEPWTDAKGVRHEHTEYHDCFAFGAMADWIMKSCRKGTEVIVHGCNRTSEYPDPETGDKKIRTKVKIEWMKPLRGQRETKGEGR